MGMTGTTGRDATYGHITAHGALLRGSFVIGILRQLRRVMYPILLTYAMAIALLSQNFVTTVCLNNVIPGYHEVGVAIE